MIIQQASEGKVADNWLSSLIEQEGYRVSGQRSKLYSWLVRQWQTFTIESAISELADAGVSVPSIYRNLGWLEKHGLLKYTCSVKGCRRYYLVKPKHSHRLICQSCGRIEEFSDCGWPLWGELVELKTGFHITRHHLEVIGVCNNCK